MKIFLRKLASFDENLVFLRRMEGELVKAAWISVSGGRRVFGPTNRFLEEFG